MVDAVTTSLLTEDELMALGSDANIEIVDGEIVEMSPVGGEHQFIGGNFYDILKPHVKENNLGFVFFDGLIYILQLEEGRVRRARVPDISFIRKEAIPSNWNIKKPLPVAPTLAIEVMSPDDKAEEILIKVREYLEAGSEQVWVAYPSSKEIHQHLRGSSQVTVYSGDDVMKVDSLFPGLELSLTALFALPELGLSRGEE
jgi:Uma2 family endonuclease